MLKILRDHVFRSFFPRWRSRYVIESVCVSILLDVLLTQTEKAYQKQRLTFQNSKAVLLGDAKKKKKNLRFVRNVGLGFKTPREVSSVGDRFVEA